ncbi:hypothetical protein [Halomonas sp. NO4]|uniref:hypothetical protein n=1 Tax=Halomonas sp. NO4 TaxID=2484813 RepID=UPI0013D544F7|nr:hypothetical protein [Halomonas sp. NO4]
MLRWLTGRKPVPVWVIKQIDDGLLHLCGQGSVEPMGKRSEVLAQLPAGRFEGAVKMSGIGLVLNARLFAALVPIEALGLDAQGRAYWQGRVWDVAQVPQRCWTFDGHLTVQRQVQGGQTLLVSTEDVSAIRRQVRSSADPGVVKFGVYGADEDPLLTPKDDKTQPPSRIRQGREWRNDDNKR